MERLTPPIRWKIFSESFLAKFFPMTAKAEMKRQFINLNQGIRTMDQYAIEFTRLNRFAQYLVAQQGDRAKKFLQGLDINIQSHIAILSLNTYAQVLETAKT